MSSEAARLARECALEADRPHRRGTSSETPFHALAGRLRRFSNDKPSNRGSENE
jgi:hypothetical protein